MKITVMGDLHYVQDKSYKDGRLLSEKFTEARDLFFNQYLKNFFAVDSDYYVSIGDLTNMGTTEELTGVYEKINSYDKHFIHTLGNHDLYSQTREDVLSLIKQSVNYSIDLEQVKLIFWETARVMDREVYSGYVTGEQLEWLERELKEAGEKTVILFGHHPIYDTTFRSNYKNLFIESEIEIFSILKKKKGNGIYVCGHNHYDSIVQKENWAFVQIAAALDAPNARIFNITEDKVTISDQIILDDTYGEKALYLAQQMDHFNPIWDGKGTTKNRNAVLRNKGTVLVFR